jgi:hypothetical protein
MLDLYQGLPSLIVLYGVFRHAAFLLILIRNEDVSLKRIGKYCFQLFAQSFWAEFE